VEGIVPDTRLDLLVRANPCQVDKTAGTAAEEAQADQSNVRIFAFKMFI
jgi:hypothetical protein